MYTKVSLLTTHNQVTKALSNERLKTVRIYEENLCAAEHRLETVLLNKPRYTGAAILAIFKTTMYDFHYSYMTEKFPNAKLLFTDTDSFCYHVPNVKMDAFYAEIKEAGDQYFDFSNFPKDHLNSKLLMSKLMMS